MGRAAEDGIGIGPDDGSCRGQGEVRAYVRAVPAEALDAS